MDATVFNEDYYMRGPEIGVSNYLRYSWQPEATLPACVRMMRYLGAEPGETVLDYGCARGYYVRALRLLGYDARGYDISEWAIANCDPEVQGLVSHTPTRADWVLCKDTLEHVPHEDMAAVLESLRECTRKGLLVIVPLVDVDDEYINPADRRDATHRIRWTITEWSTALATAFPRFKVSAKTKLEGVKAAAVPGSCGFITVRA